MMMAKKISRDAHTVTKVTKRFNARWPELGEFSFAEVANKVRAHLEAETIFPQLFDASPLCP